MKKTIILAAAAVVLAGCAKNELTPMQSEISFKTLQVSTKALIFPGDNAGVREALPIDAQFGVFAFVDGNYTAPLMNDVPVGCDTKNQNQWGAQDGNTYIWPSAGSVDFYAYYPAATAATFNSTAKAVAMTGINLGSVIGSQVDPLVATNIGLNAADKPVVGLVFKHLASQVLVSAYDATQTASLQGKIVIKSVEFKGAYTQGDYTDGTTAGKGSWSNQAAPATFAVFSGEENVPVGAANQSFLSQGSFTNSIDNNSAFVVVPEDVVAGQQKIKVVYDILPFTNAGYTFPKRENIAFEFDLVDQVNDNRFKPGTRYVFHLAFTLDGANNEITFAPEVEGWAQEDITGILIDVENNVLL